jgi:hypothetical protein
VKTGTDAGRGTIALSGTATAATIYNDAGTSTISLSGTAVGSFIPPTTTQLTSGGEFLITPRRPPRLAIPLSEQEDVDEELTLLLALALLA